MARTEELVKDLPFDNVYTDLKPDGKFQLVQELQKAGRTILMVGDGLNDSAALTLADIGVVMNESADISKQMSDILLLDNRLDFFEELNSLSESLQKLIQRNIQETVVINESADISKQMSDILLLDNRLDFFEELNSLSESLQKLIQRNIQETVVINGSLIGFGLLNWLSPSNLSILHNLTTLRIVLRSLSIKSR